MIQPLQSRAAPRCRECSRARAQSGSAAGPRTRARQSAKAAARGRSLALRSGGRGPLGRSSSTPASSNASRMAQMRKAMSSGSAAASSSTAPGRALGSTWKAARWGGAGPRPVAGGAARRGAANRSNCLPPPAPRPGRRAPRARSLCQRSAAAAAPGIPRRVAGARWGGGDRARPARRQH